MSKIALVIGASSGVGAVCMRYLAQAGYCIIGAARRVENIKSQLLQLPQSDLSHEAFKLDVTSRDSIYELVDDLVSRYKVPNTIVYCAGVNQYGLIHKFDKNAWNQAFGVNTKGAFDVCAAFVPHLSKGNSIIIVGSTAGLDPFEGGTIYCASKAAVHAFAVALRRELRSQGIRVCLVMPGSINTEFWDTERPDAQDLLSAESVAQLITAAALTPEKTEISEIVVRPIIES